MKAITKSAYARRLGCHRSYITKLVKQGVLRQTANGLIDPVGADRRIGIQGMRFPPIRFPANSPEMSVQQYRAQSEAYKAALLRLDLGVRIGTLLNVADVRRDAFRRAREFRNALLQVPARIGPMVAAETDRVTVARIIDVEVKKVVDLIADGYADGPRDD